MDTDLMKEIKGKLHFGLVELVFNSTNSQLQTRAGYLGKVVEGEIPEEYRSSYPTKPPFVEFAPFLDRNLVPHREFDIELENIRGVRILKQAKLGGRNDYPTSDVVEVSYRNQNRDWENRPGYLMNNYEILKIWQCGRPKPPHIELYTSLDADRILRNPLQIKSEDIRYISELVIVDSVGFS